MIFFCVNTLTVSIHLPNITRTHFSNFLPQTLTLTHMFNNKPSVWSDRLVGLIKHRTLSDETHSCKILNITASIVSFQTAFCVHLSPPVSVCPLSAVCSHKKKKDNEIKPIFFIRTKRSSTRE